MMRRAAQPKGRGKQVPASAASELNSALSNYRSPNADKFVPNCVSIRTSPLDTVSDLIDFLRLSATMSPDNRFSLVIDDQVH